jgi:steroid delta-isomerase-like uncharacterized protein
MSLPEKNSSQEKRNKELVETFVEEIFNKHNLSKIEKYLSPAGGKGSEGFEQFLSSFFNAFPDWHANVEHMVAEGNFVVIFLNGNGTHQGEFQGMPPTRKPVNIRAADLYKIENGKIVEHTDVVDQLNLLQQTGATL